MYRYYGDTTLRYQYHCSENRLISVALPAPIISGTLPIESGSRSQSGRILCSESLSKGRSWFEADRSAVLRPKPVLSEVEGLSTNGYSRFLNPRILELDGSIDLELADIVK